MQKLLIADGTEEFCQALARQLTGEYRIRMCRNGKEALTLYADFKPDVMVVDLMLAELDGLSLIQQIQDAGGKPQVLATTRFLNDYVMQTVSRLGVGYLMVKPCDIRATASRLRDLTASAAVVKPAVPDMKTSVSNLLILLGISTKLRGYTYLREAILLYLRKPGQMMTKEIYPEVGKICDASWEQVERSVRSAIVAAYHRRNEVIWRRYFQPDAAGNLPRPSNTVFISTLANALTRENQWEQCIQTTGKDHEK